MPAGGKSHDADPLGIKSPVGRMGAGQAHRLPRIQQRHRMVIRITHLVRNPVFADDASHPNGIKPLCHLPTFMINRQNPVRAARTNDNRRPRSLLLGREKNANIRGLNMRHPGNRVAFCLHKYFRISR